MMFPLLVGMARRITAGPVPVLFVSPLAFLSAAPRRPAILTTQCTSKIRQTDYFIFLNTPLAQIPGGPSPNTNSNKGKCAQPRLNPLSSSPRLTAHEEGSVIVTDNCF